MTSPWRKDRLRLFAALAAVLLLAVGAWFLKNRGGAPAARSEALACALPPVTANAAHPGMLWVPGGSFPFGDNVYPEEQPQRQTSVAGFWMDRTEVSNDAFAEFVRATGYVTVAERAVDLQRHPGLPPDMQKPGAVVFVVPDKPTGREDVALWWRYIPGANWRHPGGPATSIDGHGAFPVVTVTLEDAQAYAAWKGRSLPSEAQWEWAARGGRAPPVDSHEQPADANTWQGVFPFVNSGEDGFLGLAPSGCYAANGYGLFDMIGNVWELTTDAWRDGHAPAATPDEPGQVPVDLRGAAHGRHVIKGGSFLCAPNYCMRYRAGARQPQEDDLGASHLGFRTILLAPP